MDVTAESKLVINTVAELKGKYGKNTLLDVLLGANNAKIDSINGKSLKMYGCLANKNKSLVIKIIDNLLINGYLITYKKYDYPLIKLGDYSHLKEKDDKLIIKIIEEDKKVASNENTKEEVICHHRDINYLRN